MAVAVCDICPKLTCRPSQAYDAASRAGRNALQDNLGFLPLLFTRQSYIPIIAVLVNILPNCNRVP